jgi:predicted ATPase
MIRSFEEQCDHITDMIKAIPMDGSISVLTGSNGTGKSLVRTQLSFRAKEQKKVVVHSSMALRTGLHSELGGMGVFLRDDDWNATSYETIRSIKKAIQSTNDNFLCLDEIEIGCSTEMIMGMALWLNEHLRPGIEGSLGCLVITHSPYVVEHLEHDNWFNMDNYETAEAWLARPIEPVDLDAFIEEQQGMFKAVRGRMKSK